MGEPSNLERARAWLDTPREEKADTSPEARRGWWDATLGADRWASDPRIDGEDAACLLAGFHPVKAPKDWDTHTTEFAGPDEFYTLRKWCQQGEPMSLSRWRAAALEAGKFVHPWVLEYLGETPEPAPKKSGAATWELIQPKRLPGYRRPLYQLLKRWHSEGRSIPTAAQVLEEWRSNKPDDIVEIKRLSMVYVTGTGKEKPADTDAIARAIKGLIKSQASG